MFLSVNDLAVRDLVTQVAFDSDGMDLGDPDLRLAGKLTADVEASLGAGDEIRVAGRLTGEVEVVCDRCAEPFRVPIDGAFDLRYEPSENEPEAGEHGITARETEIGFYEGEGVELADVVREQILLSLPSRLLCGAECKGICPQCGQNRNKGECQCRSVPADPRWDALAKLARR
ncbi:MAG: DUF177 domain-containing protein [Bryobacteraceae bacterium]